MWLVAKAHALLLYAGHAIIDLVVHASEKKISAYAYGWHLK